MRMILVIAALAGIAVGLVRIRRSQLQVAHERRSIQSRHVQVRREIWDQEVRLGHLLSPSAIQWRAETMALELADDPPESFVLQSASESGGR